MDTTPIISDSFSASILSIIHEKPLCAWCLAEKGIPAGEGSHGICKIHANTMLLQQRAYRKERAKS